MSDFIERSREDFYSLKWLDQYMVGHKGYIAGGCFKNIFNNEKVKDLDIFFEKEEDFIEANKHFTEHSDYSSYYQNKKVNAYKNKNNNMVIELIKTLYATPEEMLKQFDFSITKFAYYKDIEVNIVEGDVFDDKPKEEFILTYKIIHHKDFFEHLLFKRLVVGDEIKFLHNTFERMLRYAKYGYFPCRETKINIINAIRSNPDTSEVVSTSFYNGID